MVFIMFAIVALRFMGGKFYSCNDGAAITRADCFGSFLDPSTNVNPSPKQ